MTLEDENKRLKRLKQHNAVLQQTVLDLQDSLAMKSENISALRDQIAVLTAEKEKPCEPSS